MFGYVIFRTTTLAHFGGYIAAMAGFTQGTPNFDVPGDIALALIVGIVICLLPATPLWDPLLRAYKTRAFPYAAANALLLGLYVLSLARAMATPFKPFIYFRF
jgi:alginate O-acetyltransferase complex protein AlgI